MQKFILPIAIFFLIFFCGISGILYFNLQSGPPETSSVSAKKTMFSREEHLPHLSFPLGCKAEFSDGTSWEYTGEIDCGFVAARARFVSHFQHLSWFPDKQMTMDDASSPLVIYTFQSRRHELVLMLWKININTTGFACRRQKQGIMEGTLTE